MQQEKSLVVNNHFQLQWEEKQDCYVLLYPEGMVQLNQSAGEILNLCDGKNCVKDIERILEEKFDVKGLLPQIIDFLEESMSKSWIQYNEK